MKKKNVLREIELNLCSKPKNKNKVAEKFQTLSINAHQIITTILIIIMMKPQITITMTCS